MSTRIFQTSKSKSTYMDTSNSTNIFLYQCKRYRHYLEQLINCANITLKSEPVLSGTANHMEAFIGTSSYEKKYLHDEWDKAALAQSNGEYYKSLIDWIVRILNEIEDSVVITALLRCYIVNDISRINFSKQIGINDNTLNKKIRSTIFKTITQTHIDEYNVLIRNHHTKLKSIR